MSWNIAANRLTVLANETQLGEWNMRSRIVDDYNQENTNPYKIIVKPCYYKCRRCVGEDFDQCTVCKTTSVMTYYLQYA